jgi:AcrR family transcriptional regulator
MRFALYYLHIGKCREHQLKVQKNSESRENLLLAAEKLFMRKGYAATTLRDISSELGVSHASLYYHFPGGKESLFEAVTEKSVLKHGEGLTRSLSEGGSHLLGRMLGAASWLLSNPPMDLIRMAETDMPALPEAVARRLMELIYLKMLLPLNLAFEEARLAGEIASTTDSGLVASALFGMLESLHAVPVAYVKKSKIEMAGELIAIMLKGIEYREGEPR